jgi:hypothetical protein
MSNKILDKLRDILMGYSPSYKPKSIPIVDEGTVYIVDRLYGGDKERQEQTLKDFYDTLKRENPNLVKFIDREISRYPKELQDQIRNTVLLVCLLLRVQGEIDSYLENTNEIGFYLKKP